MKKYKYNMHHQWLTAPRIGELNPMFMQEVTPGDVWAGHTTGVFRLAPLDLPAYMSLNIFCHIFFVPHSLVFPEFEEVITGADTSTAWPVKTWDATDLNKWLSFGVTGSVTNPPVLNEIPLRVLNFIWNHNFRNHLTTAEVAEDYTGTLRVNFPSQDYYGGIQTEIQQDTEETIDTSGATVGVTAIRDAMNRQRMKERRALYGERYRDLLASYGVRARDSRLDRPEHVCRGKTTIGISEVVATATSASENTGEYRGHGIAGMRMTCKPRRFYEHGTLMGVMYARPRLQLKTRLDKHWYIQDKEDLYHPELASDTMVNVKHREVFVDSTADSNLGYQSRDEWLRKPRDTIAGGFRTAGNDAWTAHIALTSVPTVPFMQQVQDYDHLFQDQTATRLDLHSFFDHKIKKYSIVKPRKR